MYLRRLELVNFRNFNRQVIEPGIFFNIFTGMNAQGKTNILESIYFACTGKSFRTAREKEIINWESDHAFIDCLFETERRNIEVKILLRPGKKKVDINGVLARGYPLGWPGVVLFTPDDLKIIKGSPQERRRFFDLEIGPFHPRYSYYLGRYNRVLSQRNILLRGIKEKRIKSKSLKAWNEQFCYYGSKILFLRFYLLKKFCPFIKDLHRQLTGGKEDIDIRYHSSLNISGLTAVEDIYARFFEELQRIENEEIARAQSLIGPHRDDLSILINGADARIYGSRGQVRTIVITLKISQIQLWYEELNEYPVMLMDDVLSELDSDRRQFFLEKLNGLVQTFITTTGIEDFKINHSFVNKMYSVSEGNIINL